jgi:hypothetical protein
MYEVSRAVAEVSGEKRFRMVRCMRRCKVWWVLEKGWQPEWDLLAYLQIACTGVHSGEELAGREMLGGVVQTPRDTLCQCP